MPQRPLPLFLEKRSYRGRRMMDALRLFPILGAGLWMMPILWPNDPSGPVEAMPMSRALLYIFVVWILLIVGVGLLSRRVPKEDLEPDSEPHDVQTGAGSR